MAYCKGICKRYRATKPHDGTKNGSLPRYATGQKRCSLCSIFIRYDGWKCPCCHYQLRGKPHARKYSEKYRRMVGAGAVT